MYNFIKYSLISDFSITYVFFKRLLLKYLRLSISFGLSILGDSGAAALDDSSLTSGILSRVLWGGSFSDDESGCFVVVF